MTDCEGGWRRSLRAACALLLSVLLPGAAAAAPAPAAERLYVSDERGGEVVIVDARQLQVLGHVAVGKRPRGMVISPDRKRLYVALTGSPAAGPGVDESKLPPPDRRYDGIGVIDLASQRLVHTYPSGIDPETFALSHDGRTLYVSNEDSGQLSALDVTQGSLKVTVAVGTEPEGVAVSADDRLVYVACETSNAVYVVDARSMKVLAQVPTQKRPRAIYLSRHAHRGYVSAEFGAALTEFSTEDYKVVRSIDLGDPKVVRPMGLASPDGGRHLYVTTGRFGKLLEVDTQSGQVVRAIDDIGARPWGIALSSDGRTAYTANGPSGDVSVIDLKAGQVKARVKVGGSPWGIVLAVPAD
ncbi:MAG TPA: cytochrome D1 domain-containing protein [Steroidobacteraceae bacterium]|nr:cytochrome D1 domain-containing protein [Steroidobacteraceae bacterium]